MENSIQLEVRLRKCKTREEGFSLLNTALKTKQELEQFAKFLNLCILQDSLESIRESIISSTIGRVLSQQELMDLHTILSGVSERESSAQWSSGFVRKLLFTVNHYKIEAESSNRFKNFENQLDIC